MVSSSPAAACIITQRAVSLGSGRSLEGRLGDPSRATVCRTGGRRVTGGIVSGRLSQKRIRGRAVDDRKEAHSRSVGFSLELESGPE